MSNLFQYLSDWKAIRFYPKIKNFPMALPFRFVLEMPTPENDWGFRDRPNDFRIYKLSCANDIPDEIGGFSVLDHIAFPAEYEQTKQGLWNMIKDRVIPFDQIFFIANLDVIEDIKSGVYS